jgi:hypothetical protein
VFDVYYPPSPTKKKTFSNIDSNIDDRSILRNVFQLNATQDEPDAVDGSASDDANEPTELTAAVLAAGAAAASEQLPLPAEQVIPPVDLATDALHHELGRELYEQHLRQRGRRYEEFSNDDEQVSTFKSFSSWQTLRAYKLERLSVTNLLRLV